MTGKASALSPSPDSPSGIGDGVDTKSVEAGQAEIREEASSQCSRSPPSFDSLTCDLEAPTGEASHRDDDATNSTKVDGGAVAASSSSPSSSSMCDPTTERISRSNLSSSWPRSNYSTGVVTTLSTTNLYHHEENNSIPQRRRVSFSPKVEVRKLLPMDFEEEYSPRSMDTNHQERNFFIRNYLYYMVLAMAAAIVAFSLVHHTELLSSFCSSSSRSPMMATLRGADVFQRAENMLRSQWGVEL